MAEVVVFQTRHGNTVQRIHRRSGHAIEARGEGEMTIPINQPQWRLGGQQPRQGPALQHLLPDPRDATRRAAKPHAIHEQPRAGSLSQPQVEFQPAADKSTSGTQALGTSTLKPKCPGRLQSVLTPMGKGLNHGLPRAECR